jgi:hypothetical protein
MNLYKKHHMSVKHSWKAEITNTVKFPRILSGLCCKLTFFNLSILSFFNQFNGLKLYKLKIKNNI